MRPYGGWVGRQGLAFNPGSAFGELVVSGLPCLGPALSRACLVSGLPCLRPALSRACLVWLISHIPY